MRIAPDFEAPAARARVLAERINRMFQRRKGTHDD
jgi:hypothetical protein